MVLPFGIWHWQSQITFTGLLSYLLLQRENGRGNWVQTLVSECRSSVGKVGFLSGLQTVREISTVSEEIGPIFLHPYSSWIQQFSSAPNYQHLHFSKNWIKHRSNRKWLSPKVISCCILKVFGAMTILFKEKKFNLARFEIVIWKLH